GPALAASDAAVLCVPADAEGAVLAAPYLRLIDEARLPCFLFVNKVDAGTERMRDIVSALQAYCAHSLVLRQIPMREDGKVVGAVDLISERAWKYQEGQPSALIELPDNLTSREQEARTELLESMADFDDALLEQLIEDKQPATGDVFDLATRIVQGNDLIEVFMGAARLGNGVTRLMKSLRHEAPGHDNLNDRLGGTQAVAFAADNRKHVGKMVAVRALGGAITVGEALGGGNIGNLTGLDGKSALTAIPPGGVGFAVKSDHLHGCHTVDADEQGDLPDWAVARVPGYERIVTPANERDDVRLSGALDRLAEIDPGVTLRAEETSGKAVLAMQGPLHARRITEKLEEDFGIAVEMAQVPSAYRETISKTVEQQHRHRKQSGGAGQFADVLIRLAPQARGAGFAFEEQVKGGAVPRNYIPAVGHGAEDALAEGPHGYPVVDVKVVLLDGKHHAVDSSDFAFRTAGKAAVKEAINAAKPQMLQPIMSVAIHVPSIFAGGLVPVISGLKGQVLGFEGHPTAAGWDVFNTLLPAASREELFRTLGSATRGTAWFEAKFDHFEPVSAEEVARAESASLETA
ncbi:MAG: elongation factor G, partial [Paracoccaceae bacterium]